MNLKEKAQYLSLAEYYFRNNNYLFAKNILDKVIKVDSSNSKANELLAYINANSGEFDVAFSLLTVACNENDCSAEALYYLGLIQIKKGLFPQAIYSFKKSILKGGDFFEALYELAKAQVHMGEFALALDNYQKCLIFGKVLHELFFNIAGTLDDLRRYEEALAHYDKALSLKSDYAEAWFNKGITLYNLKRYDEALAHYDKMLSLKPDYVEAWFNKGAALNSLKHYEEALAHYDKTLSLKPDYAEAWFNKGITLDNLKHYDKALAHYDKMLSLKPDYVEAWFNKGGTLCSLERYEEALAHYDKALSLKPDYAEAWFNKGTILYNLKRYDEALAHYDKVLNLKPDYAEAWFNKGATLNNLKRYEEALAHYDKALSLKPDIDWLFGDWLHLKMKICSWSGLKKSFDLMSEKLMVNEKVITPFPLLSLTDDGLLHKKSSEIYIQSKYPSNSLLGPILRCSNNQKIRVGYFSADFHNHATGYLVAELFELHDKNKFELVGFSFGPIANDEIRHRLEKSFDHFIEVGDKTDIEVAKLTRDLNIHIAVDLKGFTQDARTGIFAYRVAPVQVSYLGYPGTLGINYMDYIIADKTLIPPESRQFYSEKVVYLPDSYQVNDRKRVISERQFVRQELGLPEGGFIFCCFNNNYKILPVTFASWMRILKAVEGSVLWLFEDNYWASENLKNEAEKYGISADRLVFAKRLPLHEHLARYRQANLFLDTFPYNAHTTASDALWAGLPVLTLMGQSFASRVAASLLNAVGLPELITSSQEEYEALAIEFAKNAERLESIKQKLINNRFIAPLFDTPRFTKNLEVAYIKIYENYKAGIESNNMFI